MKRHVLLLLPLAVVLSAGAASAPAFDLSSPQKAMTAFCDAIDAEDLSALRAIFIATTKPSQACADDYAQSMVSLHRFHRVMAKYFPGQNPPATDAGSAASMQALRAEIAKMTFTLRGNRATATSDSVSLPGMLVFNGQRWQFNLDRLENVENYLNEKSGTGLAMQRLMARGAPVLDAIAADIESGKLKTYDEVTQAVTQRASGISDQMEKEFRDQRAAAELELSTPEKAMAVFLNAVEAENYQAVRDTLKADSSALDFGSDYARLLVSCHRFHRLMAKKFPASKKPLLLDLASPAWLKNLRDQLAHTTFQITGDQAAPTPGDSPLPTIKLLHVRDKIWRLDFDRLPRFADCPPDLSTRMQNALRNDTPIDTTPEPPRLLARYTDAIDALADDIDSEYLTTVDQVAKAFEDRVAPIQAQVEKALADLQAKQKATP